MFGQWQQRWFELRRELDSLAAHGDDTAILQYQGNNGVLKRLVIVGARQEGRELVQAGGSEGGRPCPAGPALVPGLARSQARNTMSLSILRVRTRVATPVATRRLT